MLSASFIGRYIVALLTLSYVSPSLGVYLYLPSEHSMAYLPRLGLDFDISSVDVEVNADHWIYYLRGGATTSLGSEVVFVSGEDPTPSIDENELVYATIGVVNVPTTHGDNSILLCYNFNENSTIQTHETWGITTPYARNDAALAETTGCLCHGIVLNLSQQIWGCGHELFMPHGTYIDSRQLDDIMLCLVKGILRRSKGTQQITIPVILILEGANSSTKETAVKYVQEYMTRAFYHLRLSNTAVIDDTYENSEHQQCQVIVSYSDTSIMETAARMATKFLQQSTTDGVRRHNVVSRLLFGTLCNQLYNGIRARWRISSDDRNSDILMEWEKLSEYSNDIISSGRWEDNMNTIVNTIDAEPMHLSHDEHPISADLKRNVESIMAMAFVDAEECILEMECRIDNSCLEFGGDEIGAGHPSPGFGSDVDSIVGAMSSSFISILGADDFTESEKAWVRDQRTQALKQLVGMGIHRVFHLHLQSLRDYFGQYYEFMLDDSVTVDAHNWRLRRRKAARHAEEQFTKAAVGSIPQICRTPDGELCNDFAGMFSCAEALRGLLEDIEEVSATRDDEENEWLGIVGGRDDEINNDMEALAATHSRLGLRQLIKRARDRVQSRGPARWYERWAAKLFVIGVNYVQGWMVLQALRREAKKRDTEMPKFPLF